MYRSGQQPGSHRYDINLLKINNYDYQKDRRNYRNEEWHNDALDGLIGEMADMETLIENIEKSLAGLNEDS